MYTIIAIITIIILLIFIALFIKNNQYSQSVINKAMNSLVEDAKRKGYDGCDLLSILPVFGIIAKIFFKFYIIDGMPETDAFIAANITTWENFDTLVPNLDPENYNQIKNYLESKPYVKSYINHLNKI